MALFDFANVKATIGALASEVQKLRGEREALLQKREELEGQPTCKSDSLKLLDDWIDRRGADFPAKLEAGVSYYARHPLLNLPESRKAAAHPVAVLTAVCDPNAMVTLQTLEGSLFYLLGDAIKSGVRQAVEQLDFSSSGPPRAERIEMIQTIDKRIDELDTLERSLVEQAEQSGL